MENFINVEAIKVRENVKALEYAHGIEDSGMDVYVSLISCKEDGKWCEFLNYTLKPNETVIVKTGWRLKVPCGYEIQVRPTSGNSLKTKLRVANSPGTVDAGYEDEIGVIVENIGDGTITLSEGAKVAQLVFVPIVHANISLVDAFSSNSNRGLDAYGSTGTILSK